MSKHVLNTRFLPAASNRRQANACVVFEVPAVQLLLGLGCCPSGGAGDLPVKGSLVDEEIVWCSEQQVWMPSERRPSPQDGTVATISEGAIDALYRTHSARLLRRFARSAAGDEAGDLVQEAFYRLVRLGSERFQSVQKAEAYLSSIASNLLRDRAKAARRRSTAMHEPLEEERLQGYDQQRLLEQRDLLNRLEQAMLKLKPKTREIFMAHRLDGLSYAEIAERTGLSVKGVEKQMCKAIAQLDRSLHRS
jgi:RNA polymerase sigma-70 factor (ECF subfamily)